MLTKYSQFMILDSKLICSRERERERGDEQAYVLVCFVVFWLGGGYCGGGVIGGVFMNSFR